ncbi:MAG: type II toxin-antitoxin system RelE/ParE family toxin [Betaproteobacteria bacterium]|nr:type II toxin-antitoxin system RelE/ParE family toxin [Betaproteobacteria bacterium]
MSRSIHRFAADDLAEAVRFPKKEAGNGVARRLLNEFERVSKLIEEFPGIGTPTADGRQSFPLVDFPYSVIYRAEESGIRILVVRHQNRDPEYGDSRR